MENYKEKYEQALDQAFVIHKAGRSDIKQIMEQVFPELKESEDERIRKELIAYCQVNMGHIWHNIKQEDYIAWLEKIGEQKPAENAEPKFKVGQTITSKDGSGVWYATIIELNDYSYYCKTDSGTATISFDAEDKYELVEKKATWSEEDEAALGDALWCCKQAASIAKDENDMGNIWYTERWLKSLKPQNRWKPSDEQIDALNSVCGEDSISEDDRDMLIGLYTDLKKLKG